MQMDARKALYKELEKSVFLSKIYVCTVKRGYFGWRDNFGPFDKLSTTSSPIQDF